MPKQSWDGVDKFGDRKFFQISQMKDGETARIAILAKEPCIEYVHYNPATQTFVCLGEKDFDRNKVYRLIDSGVCCEMLGESGKPQFCLPVLHYDTNSKGKINGTPKTAEYELKLWTFPQSVANILNNAMSEYGAQDQDWLITVKKQGQWINIASVVPTKELFWKKVGIKKRVEADHESWSCKDVEANMARTIDEDRLVELLQDAGKKGKKGKKGRGRRGSVDDVDD